jgi:hypothetical protein
MMTPTAWEIRNTLIAVLNAAQRSGKPYVDLQPSDLDKGLRADRKPCGCGVMHRDIMTKMMRPGDRILKDSEDDQDAQLVIRYAFDTNHNIA